MYVVGVGGKQERRQRLRTGPGKLRILTIHVGELNHFPTATTVWIPCYNMLNYTYRRLVALFTLEDSIGAKVVYKWLNRKPNCRITRLNEVFVYACIYRAGVKGGWELGNCSLNQVSRLQGEYIIICLFLRLIIYETICCLIPGIVLANLKLAFFIWTISQKNTQITV